jgi:hypothetical protein
VWGSKFVVIADKSTTLSQKSASVVYLRLVLENDVKSVFTDHVELDAKDSETVDKQVLSVLKNKCVFTQQANFFRRSFVAFGK